MIYKTQPISQYPDIEKIRDKMTKEFNHGLADVITKAFRDFFDDIKALEKVERVTSLVVGTGPTANLDSRGKMVLLEGTGTGADALVICVDTGSGGFKWRTVTVT